MNEKITTVPFEEMHRHLKGIIERYAFSLTNSRYNVEDTAQDIFVKVWMNWSKLRDLSKEELEDYVYVMTKNYILNIAKRKRNERRYIEYYVASISATCVHDEILIAEGFKIYKQAIEKLSPKEKQVYHYFEKDYCRCEIAACVGRSENTVNNQLHAAFKKVRKYLNKNFDLNVDEDARCRIYSLASLN
jgi:RNA polymerase sigma-70 factor (ECF subfamily)